MSMSTMERYRDDYFKDCDDLLNNKHSYKNHVDKFIEYLKIRGLADRPQAINRDVVDACIGYYSQELGELNTRSTLQAHLEALKSFYDYLARKEKLEDIFSDYDYKEFKDNIVDKYNLAEPIERGAFLDEDVIRILKMLEKAIDDYSEKDSRIRDEERYLQRIILRLFIKITLIAPAKRNIVTQIKNSDFEDDYKKLNINGIKVNIPCGLSRDIVHAIKYAEEKNSSQFDEDEYLFEFLYRHKGHFRDESLNAWFYNVLKDFNFECIKGRKKTYPVEPIRNAAIQIMVKNMVSPLFISKITGIGFSMIEAKYYKISQEEYEKYLNKEVNKAIAQNEYYSYI